MTDKQRWQGGSPYSEAFDDIYFNPEDGLAETQHVFLNGNSLSQRFAQTHRFTIAELGFGTGLNCLAAWDLFQRTAPADAGLHYISFEKFPLPQAVLQESASHFPSLNEHSAKLFAHLHTPSEGIYRLCCGQMILTLVIGDVRDWLPKMDFTADAWFLDGFAPAKNPEMWDAQLLLQIGQHTQPGGSAATFTVAGAVRRGLAEAGFTVEKKTGYGRKKEMSIGTYASSSPVREKFTKPPSRVIVVGGGIAGCSAAAALARRGCEVIMLEATGDLAPGASGNPAGALYPRLSKSWSPAMRFYWDALRFMRHQLPRWQADGMTIPVEYTGMLKLPLNAEEEEKLRLLPSQLGLRPGEMRWLEREEAAVHAGLPLPTGALWLPDAVLLDPAALCQWLVDNPRITVHSRCSATALEHQTNGWQVTAADGTAHTAEHVILAHSAALRDLPLCAHLPVRWDRGQLSILSADQLNTRPSCILSHKGYALPMPDGDLIIGATHDRELTDCALRPEDHAENLTLTRQHLPGLLKADAAPYTGRASLRANVPDHLPLIGTLAPGLHLSAAHGSRGLLSAPFAAEIIADSITGTPLPITQETAATVSPLRYGHPV